MGSVATSPVGSWPTGARTVDATPGWCRCWTCSRPTGCWRSVSARGSPSESSLRRTTEGVVIGVDQSEVMVRLARRRNAAAVHSGRVDLRLGSVEALPDLGGALDKILSVNSMGFWPDPVARLSELRCRLRTGGVIAIASQPRCPGATHETSARAAREIDSGAPRPPASRGRMSRDSSSIHRWSASPP